MNDTFSVRNINILKSNNWNEHVFLMQNESKISINKLA